MKLSLIATLAAITLAGPALAQDVAKGESDFKRCKACHSIIKPDGTAVVKGGKVGPNLYNIVGRQVASEPGFKYKESIQEVGAKGVVWTEDMLIPYMTDPKDWLNKELGIDNARTGMTYKQRNDQADIAAYLASAAVSPNNPAN
ncbi:cytochrome C550 [Thioclava dalianensis]|uniref:Cytochrome C550 n=1 Tax=Thioclava dalianensis TaxID=1185766 RepID=A0A074TAB4_9RHOB|nr:c-type cytochrome [Thioclava dalianensis]KEP68639.1 cytochrome C550 [Thioclava dalianensis]SFN04155.1 cytochrome c [Thioclava dalianensis]